MNRLRSDIVRIFRALAFFLPLVCAPCLADTLILPAAVERTGEILGILESPSHPGTGTLEIEWIDALGRIVARTARPVGPGDGAILPVRLDAARARVMRNTVRTRLTRGGSSSAAEASFIARPAAGAWDDFQIVMYQEHAGARLTGLRALGVTGVQVLGYRVPFTGADVDARIAHPLAADLPWYVENIATDFYSPYHIWTPEHPKQVNFRFLEAQEKHRRDPADMSVYERTPSLSDAVWQARINQRLAETVKAHGPYRPLYYSLGDEPGIADLAAAWDFDLGAASLAAFSAWLRLRYVSLAMLNVQWGTSFANWDAVMPQTTTAAMAQVDQNYSAWNDFKAFMDWSFAAALRAGTEAVHAADPAALAGIEGGQIPGWGGWDYSLLADAVDVMEIYPAGQNIDIASALNPGLITLATTFATGPGERRRLWRSVLKGVRGLIIWDEADDVVRDDGTPGPRGASEAALYAELRGGIGALLIASPARFDPVAILYSPPSFRLDWLLKHRAGGDAWTERSSERENEDTPVRVALRGAANDLATLGIQPRWLTPELIASGALRRMNLKLLILPHALSLSDAEATAINAFTAAGGVVLTDGPAGTFDGHGRLRSAEALRAGSTIAITAPDRRATIANALAAAGVRPVATFPSSIATGTPPTITVRTNGTVTLLGVQTGRDAPSAAPEHHELRLPVPAYVRDIRTTNLWQRTDRIDIHLDAEGPAVLAISPEPTPVPTVTGPATIRAGETALIQLNLTGPTPAASTVLHVDVRNPGGEKVPLYSGNAILRTGAVAWPLPLALNDPPGDWSIHVRDTLGGGTAVAQIKVGAP